MNPNYPQVPTVAPTVAGAAVGLANPTLRENIDAKIQWHKDEIARLEQVKEKMPFMLDVNLRDLLEAMRF